MRTCGDKVRNGCSNMKSVFSTDTILLVYLLYYFKVRTKKVGRNFTRASLIVLCIVIATVSSQYLARNNELNFFFENTARVNICLTRWNFIFYFFKFFLLRLFFGQKYQGL